MFCSVDLWFASDSVRLVVIDTTAKEDRVTQIFNSFLALLANIKVTWKILREKTNYSLFLYLLIVAKKKVLSFDKRVFDSVNRVRQSCGLIRFTSKGEARFGNVCQSQALR